MREHRKAVLTNTRESGKQSSDSAKAAPENLPLLPAISESPADVLALQRLIGNRATQAVLQRSRIPVSTGSAPSIQRKLGSNIILENVSLSKKPKVDSGNRGAVKKGTVWNVKRENQGDDQKWSKIENNTREGYVPSSVLLSQPEPDTENDDVDYARVEGDLYGNTGDPSQEDVKQGNLSNCYLMAPIAAVARTPLGKVYLKGIVTSQSGGKYQIQMYDIDQESKLEPGEIIVVDNWFPVKNETFQYCPYQKPLHPPPPLWPALVEKAWATDDEDGYSGLNMENAATAMSMLTGRKTYQIKWNPDTQTQVLEEGRDQWENAYEDAEENELAAPAIPQATLLNLIKIVKQDENHALIAESKSVTKNDKDFLDPQNLEIKDTHVYVINSVDHDDKIILWDPAHRHPPAITIDDFQKVFTRIVKVNMNDLPGEQDTEL